MGSEMCIRDRSNIQWVETKDLKMPPELGEHNEEVICEWLN